jgi:hypothetical protein
MIGPAAMAAAPGAVQLGPLEAVLAAFSGNPYFTGLMMLTLNLGGRFLAMEITKGQEKFLSHPYIRRFLIFVVLFIATRNLLIAFWMSLIVILLLGYVFNENSSLCIFGVGGLQGATCSKEGFTEQGQQPPAQTIPMSAPGSQPLTADEAAILDRLKAKEKAWLDTQQVQAQVPEKNGADRETVLEKVKESYKRNIARLQGIF